mmetsp:Transcript_49965/g.115985  ORF Transcript_49965/g.115985 Transcript_49965/m.115985 type:complete len:129 (-) Transcript_49965:108-494(-)
MDGVAGEGGAPGSGFRQRSFASSSSASSASSSQPRRWTCRLCSQTRNTEDMASCRTCGRPRGHEPERYRKRLEEIRSWNNGAAGSDNYTGSEPWWGLIAGLVLLLVIAGVLAWALYEDQAEATHSEEL